MKDETVKLKLSTYEGLKDKIKSLEDYIVNLEKQRSNINDATNSFLDFIIETYIKQHMSSDNLDISMKDRVKKAKEDLTLLYNRR
jgi:hypothetical protein